MNASIDVRIAGAVRPASVARQIGGLVRNCAWAVVLAALAVSQAIADEGWVSNGSQPGWRKSESHGQVNVVVKKSTILEFRQPYDKALIADDSIADVLPLTDRSIYVVGKSVGSTSLAVLDGQKGIIAALEVDVTHDAVHLRRAIRNSIPQSRVRVTQANGRILLSGRVADAAAVKKAVAIAEQYAPDAVTNALQVRSVQQVMLEVRFVEANRTASRELGVGSKFRNKYFNADVGGQAALVSGFVSSASLVSGAAPFGAMIARLLDNGLTADAIVRALEGRGLARRLAEPNLVTMSGDKASFLAGGEFPFPVASEDNTITIEFKKFGVGLEFTPTVLGDGLINIKIEPEVSDLDYGSGIRINDTQIPGLVVRRAATTVELRDGQSFAIAGLLQQNNRRLSEELPWIGQVPVLGALFRSAEYQKSQTDLVIIVTPRLVRGAQPGQRLSTPLDSSKPSSDVDYFLLSRQQNPGWRTSVRRGNSPIDRRTGHIISLRSDGVVQ